MKGKKRRNERDIFWIKIMDREAIEKLFRFPMHWV
jgi:hypothetical protein